MEGLTARVRHLREESEMTQAALAEEAGWSQSNLSKLERGALRPGIDKLLGLQYALELASLEELFAPVPRPATGDVLREARMKQKSGQDRKR